jgi:hypothetical protein
MMAKLCQASAESVGVGAGRVGLTGVIVGVAAAAGGTLDAEGEGRAGDAVGADEEPLHDARSAHVKAVRAVERAERDRGGRR